MPIQNSKQRPLCFAKLACGLFVGGISAKHAILNRTYKVNVLTTHSLTVSSFHIICETFYGMHVKVYLWSCVQKALNMVNVSRK